MLCAAGAQNLILPILYQAQLTGIVQQADLQIGTSCDTAFYACSLLLIWPCQGVELDQRNALTCKLLVAVSHVIALHSDSLNAGYVGCDVPVVTAALQTRCSCMCPSLVLLCPA